MNPKQPFKEFFKNSLQEQSYFPLYGFIDLDFLSQNENDPHSYSFFYREYKKWIGNSYHGEMKYLEGERLKLRESPTHLFPETKTVFSVGIPYTTVTQTKTDCFQPQYARYLSGPDYHLSCHNLVEEYLNLLNEGWIHLGNASLKWKINVDTSPVFERAWGYLCGLGWVGKNTLLIHPKWGSYFFLVTVFLNEKTDQPPNPIQNYCGNCTRCLQQCPTQAFVQERVLDSKKCISYLTLEYRNEFSNEISNNMEPWIAGCDICQEVCPFNFKRSKKEILIIQDPLFQLNYLELVEETNEAYLKRVKNTALARVKPKMFKRNLAVAIRNDKNIKNKNQISALMNKIEERIKMESDPYLLKEWSETHFQLGRLISTNSIE